MTIGELEKAAGIEDRTAFWSRFSHIKGEQRLGHKSVSKALEAGITELRKIIDRGAE